MLKWRYGTIKYPLNMFLLFLLSSCTTTLSLDRQYNSFYAKIVNISSISALFVGNWAPQINPVVLRYAESPLLPQ